MRDQLHEKQWRWKTMSRWTDRAETVRASFAVMRAMMTGNVTHEINVARLAEPHRTDSSACQVWLAERGLPSRRSKTGEAANWNMGSVDPADLHITTFERSIRRTADPLRGNLWSVFKAIQQVGEAKARRGRELADTELDEKRQHRTRSVADRDTLYRELSLQQDAMDHEAALERQTMVELFGDRYHRGGALFAGDALLPQRDVGKMDEAAWAKFVARERAVQQHRLALWMKQRHGLESIDHKVYNRVIFPADLLAALRRDAVAISIHEFCDLWYGICDQAAALRPRGHNKPALGRQIDQAKLARADAARLIEADPQFDRLRLSFEDFCTWEQAYHPELRNKEKHYVLIKLADAYLFQKEFHFWLPMLIMLNNLRALRGTTCRYPTSLDQHDVLADCRYACNNPGKCICCVGFWDNSRHMQTD